MRYIDLVEYPTVGEIVFPDEPETIYINRFALPMCRHDRLAVAEPAKILRAAAYPAQLPLDLLSHRRSSILHLVPSPG